MKLAIIRVFTLWKSGHKSSFFFPFFFLRELHVTRVVGWKASIALQGSQEVEGSRQCRGPQGCQARRPSPSCSSPRSVGFGEGNLCERRPLGCHVSCTVQQPSDVGAGQPVSVSLNCGARVSGLEPESDGSRQRSVSRERLGQNDALGRFFPHQQGVSKGWEAAPGAGRLGRGTGRAGGQEEANRAPPVSPEALPGARPCEHLVPLLYGLTPEEGVALRADEDASGL